MRMFFQFFSLWRKPAPLAWLAAVPLRGRGSCPRNEDAYRECRRPPRRRRCHDNAAAARRRHCVQLHKPVAGGMALRSAAAVLQRAGRPCGIGCRLSAAAGRGGGDGCQAAGCCGAHRRPGAGRHQVLLGWPQAQLPAGWVASRAYLEVPQVIVRRESAASRAGAGGPAWAQRGQSGPATAGGTAGRAGPGRAAAGPCAAGTHALSLLRAGLVDAVIANLAEVEAALRAGARVTRW